MGSFGRDAHHFRIRFLDEGKSIMSWLRSTAGRRFVTAVLVALVWTGAFFYIYVDTEPNAGEPMNVAELKAKILAAVQQEQSRGSGKKKFEQDQKRLQPKLDRVPKMTASEREKLIADFTKQLKARRLSKFDQALCVLILKTFHSIDDYEMAAKAGRQFGQVFLQSGGPLLKMYGTMLVGSAERTELLSQVMELEGITAQGTPFDWDKYRGKVVLVEFWEMACPGCKVLANQLKEYHKQYHDRGFEVVGVCLDKNVEQVANYVRKAHIPWTTIVEGAQPFAGEKYGIATTPSMYLLDKQGKAITLELGDAKGLGKQLEKLFPSAEQKPST